MPKKDIEAEKFGNAWVIFSITLLSLLLILWFTTNNDLWTGITAFTISSILVIIYCFHSDFKNRKRVQ